MMAVNLLLQESTCRHCDEPVVSVVPTSVCPRCEEELDALRWERDQRRLRPATPPSLLDAMVAMVRGLFS